MNGHHLYKKRMHFIYINPSHHHVLASSRRGTEAMSDQQRFRQRAGCAQQPARAKNSDSRGNKFNMENFGVRLWRGGYAVKKSYYRRALAVRNLQNFLIFQA